ncbi:CoxG family protein [Ktedonospora formicarum]|uniref:Carbon monoxide dehydrogenase subunit G n=1 Tax=Ktedonospora formicarum TaxID=2778364 RepID=A0A8J3MP97_9CHLR|nr:SRPBCC domain-containing protein [Ktedonospora formicarum]GHO43602.1 hypothetical protein KSX_17650 [Ktedonospora formicarum]
MHIEGTYTLQASPEEVWQCLTDKEVLQQALTSLEQLEERENNRYGLALNIRQAPLAGIYTGQITITEQQYPYYCRFIITEGEGQRGIGGEGTLHLNERNGNTIIAYQGKLTFGKSVPSLVARGAAKLLTQQFFITLAEQLRLKRSAASGGSTTTNDIVLLTSHTSMNEQEPQSLALRFVRLLRIGKGNADEERLWATRLRQASILSALLILVWVGTRLPRKARAQA